MPRLLTPALAAALATLAFATSASAARTARVVRPAPAAAAPVVEKVDPPFWWAGHSINPVRLLVRGRNLAGAIATCGRLACSAVRVSDAGTYALLDVTVPAGVAPGNYPLTLRTRGGSTTVPFTVAAALPAAGRFQGFGPADAMYLIMPDRFANGDTANDEPAASRGLLDRSKGRRYHGGDLAGIRQRLPYLRDLGVTTLGLTPIYDNTNVVDRKKVDDGEPTTAYHGYHAIDFYAVDEHFGDLAALRQLVDDAHTQGIKIVLDMVANHTSAYHPWVADAPTPTWYNGTASNHLVNSWQPWTLADPHSSRDMRAETLNGWFRDILPDLNQDDPEVARYLIQNTLWWIGATGIDGIRQDSWPYVPRTFWHDWTAAIERQYPRFTVAGEVLDGDPALVAFFQGGRAAFDGIDGIDDGVDALVDFPTYLAARNAFAHGQALRQVPQVLSHDRLYPDAGSLVTTLGLQDVPRFMSEPGATVDGLALAFTFLLTARGTPMIYYGDEIGLPGGGDPDNRRDFPGGWRGDTRDAFAAAGRSADEQRLRAHVQALLRLRAQRTDLPTAATENLYASEQVWVYRRGATLVALNNDTTSATVRLRLQSIGPSVIGGCPAPRREAGGMTLVLPPRTGCVY